MILPPNIIFIGFMGSGKTSTGEILAKKIGFKFLDLDERIEIKNRKPVHQIFKDMGESFFRSEERKEIKKLSRVTKTVICPGGGAWSNLENRKILLKRGWCVWLHVSPKEAWRRIKSEKCIRPLINGARDPKKEVLKLLRERDPLYALSHHRINTNGLAPSEVSKLVLQALKRVRPFPLDFLSPNE